MSYIYLTLITLALVYSISKDIYQFKKSDYNPYMFRKGKRELPLIVYYCLNLGMSFGAIYLLDKELLTGMLYVFIGYSFSLIVTRSLLNYLSYVKINEPRIVLQTVIFDIIIIAISIGLWGLLV